MAITFVDQTGVALPSGISVAVTQGGTTVGTATTDATGTVAIAVTQGTTYSAAFSGPSAPTTSQGFVGGSNQQRLETDAGNELTDDSGNHFVQTTGSTTTVPVAGYTSPTIITARVTQVATEALVNSNAKARVTQISATALVNSLTNALITQVAVEALVAVVPTIVSIAVTPSTSSVGDSQTEQFTATATYDNGEVVDATDNVTWSATRGAISADGLYTASGTGFDTVTAELNGVTGTATVNDIVTYTLVLSPRAVSVGTNAQIPFTASLVGSDGSSALVDPTTWSSTAGGSITSAGLFTAGPDPSSAVQIAAYYESYSATAVVTVTATIALLPTNLAQQGIIGSISLDCPYDGDFTITPQGNLLLARDTLDNPTASRQRLQRLILTNPIARDAIGNAVGRADDLFNPEYGSGVRRAIGKPANGALAPAIVSGIIARVRGAIAKDPGFVTSPAPIVRVNTEGEVLSLYVSVTTVTGSIVTIPSLPLTTGI